jgi:hypothetical protein
VRYERFSAVLNWQTDVPLEEAVKAAHDWIRVYEAHPAAMSPYMQVASGSLQDMNTFRLDRPASLGRASVLFF